MSAEQVNYYFQAIQRHFAALQREDTVAWRELDVLLEDLHVMYEQMQTSLETIESDIEELFQQKQHYHDMFQSSPIAYLLTDALGVILETNQAAANLLNVSQVFLVGKPLAMFMSEDSRIAFRNQLNQLSQSSGTQIWQISLCPSKGEPVAAELRVAVTRSIQGWIENLRIVICDLNQFNPMPASSARVDLPSKFQKALTAHPANQLSLNESQEGQRLKS